MDEHSPLPDGTAATPEVHGGGAGAPTPGAARLGARLRHAGRQTRRVAIRVAVKSWDDSIFAKAATAAFWQTLSLAPLLLGLLGSLGYVGGLFGPDTLEIVEAKALAFSRELFSESVVTELIQPTVTDVLGQGRGAVVSFGFVLSLWAGSSAMATFVDAIVEAHDQQDARHPVWQRVYALLLYVQFLVASVFILPLVALGPELIGRILPSAWREPGLRLIDAFYYPAVGLLLIVGLTTLYKSALHKSLPWHRLFGGALVAGVFFMAASEILRRYLSWITGTGVSYGALATPIAFLLFTFFLGFAVVLGAEFNATVQEFWPARATRLEQMKEWLSDRVRGDSAAREERGWEIPAAQEAGARDTGSGGPGHRAHVAGPGPSEASDGPTPGEIPGPGTPGHDETPGTSDGRASTGLTARASRHSAVAATTSAAETRTPLHGAG